MFGIQRTDSLAHSRWHIVAEVIAAIVRATVCEIAMMRMAPFAWPVCRQTDRQRAAKTLIS